MRTIVTAFSLPKDGESQAQNQDAIPRNLQRIEGQDGWITRTFADRPVQLSIADGASEGLLSELWARILVAESSKHDPRDWKLAAFLDRCVAVWDRFHRGVKRRGIRLTDLPDWIVEAAMERGAFATFLSFRLSPDHTYDAVAIGDSCLFHFEASTLNVCWPVTDEPGFTRSPYLLSTAPLANEELLSKVDRTRGTWNDGDTFLLATDALSAWLLRCAHNGEDVCEKLRCFRQANNDSAASDFSEHTFVRFIESSRTSGLRNDDVTLILIETG